MAGDRFVQIFERGGNVAATLAVPPEAWPPDAIYWGDGLFVFKGGRYVEAMTILRVPQEVTAA